MVRTRRKSGKRLIVNCFWKCLNERTHPHLLNWTGRGREFSLFLRRKGSPTSDLRDLDFFKELDSVFPTKREKYKNQADYGQACKRRCKANLRKLCENNVFEFVRKEDIDKCRKLLYYNFLEIPSDEDVDNKLLPKMVRTRRKSGNTADGDVCEKYLSLSQKLGEFVAKEVKLSKEANYNFVQLAEDNSKSSHRCLDENLLPEAEYSFSLNEIENRKKVAEKTSEIYDSPKLVKTGLTSHCITDPCLKDYHGKREDCKEMKEVKFLQNSEMSLYQCLEKDSVYDVSNFRALWSDPCAPKISQTMDFQDLVDSL